MEQFPASLILAGAGRMGGAMLEGWLEGGLAPASIQVIEPHPSEALTALARRTGFQLNPPAASLRPARALVLGVKPQMLAEAAPALAPLTGPDGFVLSILAGKTLANLAATFPRAGGVVRVMPNLPASIRRGVSVAVASPGVDGPRRAEADALLRAAGDVEWVTDENLIDAVTAVSGSGPAYVFHLVEAMAEAGVAAGLPRALAENLARKTVIGSSDLMRASDASAAALREAVTSPGGTTFAALQVLMRDGDGMPALLTEAIAAAARRSRELSG
ncbi:pyrroline-5-carboxylate reductase [Camelimonas lactis]|uniref:Pyrroline-5-carboxylate reductase n=1 Tax=Camelimonas lactis TaxID=659006 RepID=A0A4R2GSJ2_9HYPH|nr:pyrroline-5-carboxylate reductase [Camelimonas lactis]TCO13301.1 pyrroline-5-carboxylate reductase [Camelimonas lactis]